jgi:hypothetical protein
MVGRKPFFGTSNFRLPKIPLIILIVLQASASAPPAESYLLLVIRYWPQKKGTSPQITNNE